MYFSELGIGDILFSFSVHSNLSYSDVAKSHGRIRLSG